MALPAPRSDGQVRRIDKLIEARRKQYSVELIRASAKAADGEQLAHVLERCARHVRVAADSKRLHVGEAPRTRPRTGPSRRTPTRSQLGWTWLCCSRARSRPRERVTAIALGTGLPLKSSLAASREPPCPAARASTLRAKPNLGKEQGPLRAPASAETWDEIGNSCGRRLVTSGLRDLPQPGGRAST